MRLRRFFGVLPVSMLVSSGCSDFLPQKQKHAVQVNWRLKLPVGVNVNGCLSYKEVFYCNLWPRGVKPHRADFNSITSLNVQSCAKSRPRRTISRDGPNNWPAPQQVVVMSHRQFNFSPRNKRVLPDPTHVCAGDQRGVLKSLRTVGASNWISLVLKLLSPLNPFCTLTQLLNFYCFMLSFSRFLESCWVTADDTKTFHDFDASLRMFIQRFFQPLTSHRRNWPLAFKHQRLQTS